MRHFVTFSACALLLLLGGCFSQHSVQVAPIHVAPIRVTMDVNVNVQDERAEDPSEAEVEEEDVATQDAGAAPSEPVRTARRPPRTDRPRS